MAKKRRILTVTLLIAAVGFVSWLILSQPSEPVYQGKPLSYWCDRYDPHRSPDSKPQEAETAIRAIGTNAIPTLLSCLKVKDSKFKIELLLLAQKQNIVNVNLSDASIRKWRG